MKHNIRWKDQIRICYLSDELSIHDYRFLSKLVENNFDTYLVTYSPFNIPEFIERLAGLHILHFKSRLKGKLFYYSYFLKIFHFHRVLKKIKPDILHAGLVTTCGFLGALSKFHPFLLMPWGSDVILFPFKSFIHRNFVQYVLKHPDMITCDSKFTKKKVIELSNYPEEKIITFAWGVDLSLFNPNNCDTSILKRLGWEGKKILIMMRSFRPVYGIEYFLESLSAVIKEEPECRVILVGSGPLEKKLKGMVKERNLNEFVHFAGFVENEKMPFYLNSVDVYVSTSLSDASSLSLMEAIACGLPLVVSDVPASEEWVKDGINGYRVPRKNVKILSQRIISLLKDSLLRKKMGELNLQIAKDKIDWNKNFKQLERMYETLLKTHKEGM